MPQFRIPRNAKGNRLRLDVHFPGGTRYRTTLQSWSYDGEHWQPAPQQECTEEGETLVFPQFSQDSVYFGHYNSRWRMAGRLYTMGNSEQDGADGKEIAIDTVWCLDAKTGTLIRGP